MFLLRSTLHKTLPRARGIGMFTNSSLTGLRDVRPSLSRRMLIQHSPAEAVLPQTWEEVTIDKGVWDPLLKVEFCNIPLSTSKESEWYGPWDSVVHMLFTHKEEFQVVPVHLPSRSRSGPERTAYYVIKHNDAPVLFVVIKPYTHLRRTNLRCKADDQMRKHFVEYSELLKIPTLYGLCCMGPVFSVFEMDAKSGRVLPENGGVKDYAPAERWQFNILTKEGEAELKRIAEEVKAMDAHI